MKTILRCCTILLVALFSVLGASASFSQDYRQQFQDAGKLFETGKIDEALEAIRNLDQTKELQGELKKDVRWALVGALTALGKQAREKQDWATSKIYTEEAIKVLESSTNEFEGEFRDKLNSRKFWAIKNLILSCSGLDEDAEADTYRKKLYEAYRTKVLPKGLDKNFCFEFYRANGKNIWGYEYYPNLGEVGAKDGHTKFVYYVFSTKEDGTDKDPLYRFHVSELRKVTKADKSAYVLSKRQSSDDGKESRQTLYEFIYADPVDIKKLRADIRKLVTENAESNVHGKEGGLDGKNEKSKGGGEESDDKNE